MPSLPCDARTRSAPAVPKLPWQHGLCTRCNMSKDSHFGSPDWHGRHCPHCPHYPVQAAYLEIWSGIAPRNLQNLEKYQQKIAKKPTLPGYLVSISGDPQFIPFLPCFPAVFVLLKVREGMWAMEDGASVLGSST